MAALAGMLKKSGFQVSGSDANVYPPMSEFLAGLGIAIASGYAPENIEPRPDLVVVGNVITAKNPEAQALAAAAIPYVSLPQALGHFYLSGKQSLVVTGTHGKTTTSSLLATLLDNAGLDPGFMIGGIVQAFSSNHHIGKGQYFVVEGDEYDTAFFDKGPKFLHYQPQIAIITSIEFDHADIYADLEAVKRSFARLVDIMPSDGAIVACLDHPVVREIAGAARCRVYGYGEADGLDWRMTDVSVTPDGTTFTVLKQGMEYGRFTSNMPGRHNAANAMAVIAVLDLVGVGTEIIALGLKKFHGVKRRQEVRGTVRGVTVIDDFAHHPTAVRETLAALADAYKGRRLITVFEPRSNSSRRKVFQEAYSQAFSKADIVVVREPVPLANVAEDQCFSARQLVDDLCSRGVNALYFPSTDAILDYLPGALKAGDVVAILSNGGFDNIHTRLLSLLASV